MQLRNRYCKYSIPSVPSESRKHHGCLLIIIIIFSILTDMGLIRKVQRALMISLICVVVLIIVLFQWMYSTGCSFQSHCYSSNTIDSAATKAPVPCNVNIFLESFNQTDNIKELQHNFSKFEESIPRTCPLPNGGKCTSSAFQLFKSRCGV